MDTDGFLFLWGQFRVKNENEARLRTKKFKSSKKAGRRDKGDF